METLETEDYLYRYETNRYSVVIDAESEHYGVTGPELELYKYRITSRTEKGCWITLSGFGSLSKDRWVSNNTTKRFAHPTPEEALKAIKIRKDRYVHHASVRLNKAKAEQAVVNKCLAELKTIAG